MSNIKTTVVLVAACVILSTAKPAVEISNEEKARLDDYREECKAQSGVDVEVLKKLRDGVFSEDPKFKDFLYCVSKKTGFQNDLGEIQDAVIVEKLGNALKDPKKAKELSEKCTKQEGSPSEITYKVVTCFYNNNPDHVVIVH